VTALGVGLLGAAAVGYWLSARLGLLEPHGRRDARL